MKAIIKFKESGKDRIDKTSYTGENITKEFIINWFGLEDDDIDWYDIEIID